MESAAEAAEAAEAGRLTPPGGDEINRPVDGTLIDGTLIKPACTRTRSLRDAASRWFAVALLVPSLAGCPDPVAAPPAAPASSAAPPKAAVAADAWIRITEGAVVDPRAVLERAVAAKGGLARLRSIQTVRTRARANGVLMTVTIAYPDRYLVEYFDDAGAPARKMLLDGGGQALLLDPGERRPKPMPKPLEAELRAAASASAIPLLIAASSAGANLRHVGEATVDGAKADAVGFEAGEHGEVMLFVERGTSDLIAIRHGAGPAQRTILESDFRPIDGVRVAHLTRMPSGSEVFDARVEAVTLNPTLGPDAFDMGRRDPAAETTP